MTLSFRVSTTRLCGLTASLSARLLLVLLALLVLLSAPSVHAQTTPEVVVVNGKYVYTIFRSANATSGSSVSPRDGASGVGVYCRPSTAGALDSTFGIVFSDMCVGSALRRVNMSGIFTIAGSLTQLGFADGSATQARFNGLTSGRQDVNGVIKMSSGYYLADSVNSAIRRINIETGETVTVLNSSSGLEYPTNLAPYPNSAADLLISDTSNSNIRFSQGAFLASIALPSQTQPGALALQESSDVLFFVNRTTQLSALQVTTHATWSVSDPLYTYYASSLALGTDGSELLYVGEGNAVYTVPTNLGTSGATYRPQVKFPQLVSGLRLIIPRTTTSWFLVTNNAVYLASDTEIDFNLETTTTTTTAAPESSTSSSTSGSVTSASSSSSSDGEDSLERRYRNRQHGIGGFPRDAFPVNDACLMSRLYAALRMDAEAAYTTSDYYNQFMPQDSLAASVYGTYNVTDWCGNITADRSVDNTIEVLDFWGPTGLDLFLTQDELARSPWTNTRQFLNQINNTNGLSLGPFCFLNCASACRSSTYSPTMCVDYREHREPACDDICKGAIASSVVMFVTLVVLIVLIFVSPANLYTAVIMVPII